MRKSNQTPKVYFDYPAEWVEKIQKAKPKNPASEKKEQIKKFMLDRMNYSNKAIADVCGVSDGMIRNIRLEILKEKGVN